MWLGGNLDENCASDYRDSCVFCLRNKRPKFPSALSSSSVFLQQRPLRLLSSVDGNTEALTSGGNELTEPDSLGMRLLVASYYFSSRAPVASLSQPYLKFCRYLGSKPKIQLGKWSFSSILVSALVRPQLVSDFLSYLASNWHSARCWGHMKPVSTLPPCRSPNPRSAL